MTEASHSDIASLRQPTRDVGRPVEPGTSLTRRATLWGALASSAALAVPAVAYAASKASLAVTMGELIAAHRLAFAEYRRVCAIYDEVDGAAGEGPPTRVQVGNLVSWDANCEKHREPIWAYSAPEVISYAPAYQFGRPDTSAARRQAWIDSKLAELAEATRAFADFKERTGLQAADDLTARCFEAEVAARLALIAHRPANAGEAAAKAAYMAEDYGFSPNCINGNVDQIERLFAMLGQVQS